MLMSLLLFSVCDMVEMDMLVRWVMLIICSCCCLLVLLLGDFLDLGIGGIVVVFCVIDKLG